MSAVTDSVAQRLGSIEAGSPAEDALTMLDQVEREHRPTEDLCAQVERLETRIPMETTPCRHIPSA